MLPRSWPNPPVGHPEGPPADSGGCEAGGGGSSWLFGLMSLLAVAVMRRKNVLPLHGRA